MDRRETLKSLLISSLAGGVALSSCATEETTDTPAVPVSDESGYGRTEKEKAFDKKLNSETFFTPEEATTIAILVDIILPASRNAGSATDAGVPEFIEFIVKDIPSHQVPLRGGLMWLDNYSNRKFNKVFRDCSEEQKIQIVDAIAYPEDADPSLSPGVSFFTRMRNLTLTGYYTTRMGIDDLGYKGNSPNVWDGVPDDVLKKHGLSYDPEWLAKCVDQSKRMDIARWDDEGNLLS